MTFDALNATIACFALLTSVVSIYFTWQALASQKKHNEISVRPFMAISAWDYENRIRIRITNNGIGPAKIVALYYFRSDVRQDVDRLVDLMPETPDGILWADYVGNQAGVVIAPGSSRVLLDLKCDRNSEIETAFRDVVRRALLDLRIRISYQDFYENRYKAERSLDWYGRHFNSETDKAEAKSCPST